MQPMVAHFGRISVLYFMRSFYYASAYCMTRDIDIAILSVRLSVRPSVRHVPVFYGNGLTHCHNCFTTQ